MMTSPCSSIRTRARLRAVEELEPLVHAVADESFELALDPILERCSCDLQNHFPGLAVLDDLDGLLDMPRAGIGG